MKFLFLLLCCFPTVLFAQDLKTFQWKKRVVVIESAEFRDRKAHEQVKIFKDAQDQLNDYKIVILERTDLWKRQDFKKTKKIKNKEKIKSFKVMLLGLDGRIKFESTNVEPAQKFFDIINTMPMRKSELKKGS